MSRYPWVTTRDARGNVVVPVEDAEREVERLRGELFGVNERLRAEVKDLKARLKALRARWCDCGGCQDCEAVARIGNLRLKNWRKP